MLSLIRKHRRATAPQPATQTRAIIDRLEGRLYFAHLGHEVFMPAAANNGDVGLDVVATTYTFADHRRGKLILAT